VAACDERLEPDLTNAAAFLIAGVITGGAVEVPDWPRHTTQPGDGIRDVLARFGALTELLPGTTDDSATLRAASIGSLRGVDIDLREASELTPVVAGLAAVATGETRVTGVGHIRGHETDRIAAIVETLRAVGVAADELPDGLVVHGRGVAGAHAAELKSYGDHRMVHLAALLGLVIPGITVDDTAATAKTMPDFPQRWASMAVADADGERR
jgi:3-phosphoshikimate 1-carboxyvinyltransferase